ncbi:MFS transporter [Candidatus Acetothermia bacterium]|nr:MFS transporter [Candidatus Acetothermia bacterium]
MPLKKLDAYRTFLILQGASALFFAMMTTTNLVYQVQEAHLNPLQLVLVGTILEISVFLFEIPTGVVADVYSRRWSVIIGQFLLGAGFILNGAIPRFDVILLAQVIWGVGYTFTSGATQAWIADEVGEGNAGHAFLRGAQVSQLGALIGIAIATALANVQVNLPIIIGGSLQMLLGIFLMLAMPETGFTPTRSKDRSSWQKMAQTFQDGIQTVRVRPALITILAVNAIYGMFSEGMDRLWTPHFLNDFTLPKLGSLEPVTWFGIISGTAMLLSIAGTEIVHRRIDTNSHVAVARVLSLINVLVSAGVVVFGAITNFALALVILLLVRPLRRVYDPLYTAWVNQHVNSNVRATVLSMSSQSGALGEIIGGPIFGIIATVTSVGTSLVVAGAMLLPALLLYAREIRRSEKR